MHLENHQKFILKIYKYILFIVLFGFNSSIIAQPAISGEISNQTQDWIFGDGPEPKWVVELLHGAYQNIKEDSKFVFKIPVSGTGIKYTASVDNNAVIEQDGDYLIISPDKDYNGTILVNLSLDLSFILNVQSVNDKPLISKIENQKINEDEIFELQLSASDAEGDPLTYGATVDANAKVNVVDNKLTITPYKNYNGAIKVTLAVSDGKDTDGDKLSYTVKGGPNTTFDIKDNRIIVSPQKDYSGSTPIKLTTSDGSSNIDTSFTLINPMPGITAFAPESMLEDSVLSLSLNIKDVEDDPFIFKMKKNDNAEIEINGYELKVIPKNNYHGELKLFLSISDGNDSTDFNFSINVLPVPDAPIAKAGEDIAISNGCNSKIYLDGTKSWDADNDLLSYQWSIIGNKNSILNKSKGYYTFPKYKEDTELMILLSVSDPSGLIGYDSVKVNIINDSPPLANAGIDFIAPFSRRVYLDGSKSKDPDSELTYNWEVISGDVKLDKDIVTKLKPYFNYPSEINNSKEYVFKLHVKDENSYCSSTDTVKVICLPNVDIADDNIKYEIVRAGKNKNKVFVDLNITNQKSWPFDFAALTLITVLNEQDSIGQIDPYKGKNTVKYGIEKDEKVGVELVYDFKMPPKEISILCKSTMRIKADTVFFKQKFQ